MGDHAKLSPSASGRWMTCPGSVSLIAEHGLESTESVYAQVGSAIHSVAEICLSDFREAREAREFIGHIQDGVEITADHADIAQVFIDYVRQKGGLQLYEQRVHATDRVYGTADAVIVHDGVLEIADLKTGFGVPVPAEGNTQLLCYALGAFKAFDGVIDDIKEVHATIVQPPRDYIGTACYSREQILKFEATLLEAIEKVDTHKDLFVMSDKACRFCQAAKICPAMRGTADAAAAADFTVIAEKPDDLAAWASKLPALKVFIESIEAEISDRLQAGKPVPGFKMVAGKSSRAWADEKKVLSLARKAKIPKKALFTEPKLLSPAQMEKAHKAVDWSPVITRKEGSPTVVPESDSRPAIGSAASAAEDFSAISDDLLS